MRKLEEMEEGMRLDILKQKGGDSNDDKKKAKKTDYVVEPIDIALLRTDRDKLALQIYVYLMVNDLEEGCSFGLN